MAVVDMDVAKPPSVGGSIDLVPQRFFSTRR